MREEGNRKKMMIVESLGWLTKLLIMPKKHHVIEGVGMLSMMELKVKLSKFQENSKKSRKLTGPISSTNTPRTSLLS
ncbi:hypothetical protein AHAS_Ahas19G0285300 [Arachis hypogaea]